MSLIGSGWLRQLQRAPHDLGSSLFSRLLPKHSMQTGVPEDQFQKQVVESDTAQITKPVDDLIEQTESFMKGEHAPKQVVLPKQESFSLFRFLWRKPAPKTLPHLTEKPTLPHISEEPVRIKPHASRPKPSEGESLPHEREPFESNEVADFEPKTETKPKPTAEREPKPKTETPPHHEPVDPLRSSEKFLPHRARTDQEFAQVHQQLKQHLHDQKAQAARSERQNHAALAPKVAELNSAAKDLMTFISSLQGRLATMTNPSAYGAECNTAFGELEHIEGLYAATSISCPFDFSGLKNSVEALRKFNQQ